MPTEDENTNSDRKKPTRFVDIYDAFFGKITDDMYVEWTFEETRNDLKNMLLDSIPNFEFPRFALYDYTVYSDEEKEINPELKGKDTYNCHLTKEEINILAQCMLETWIQRQMTSIENTRQKFSGVDFKMTSQANHLAKLTELYNLTRRQNLHIQRLYKRRKPVDGKGQMRPNWHKIMRSSTFSERQIWY